MVVWTDGRPRLTPHRIPDSGLVIGRGLITDDLDLRPSHALVELAPKPRTEFASAWNGSRNRCDDLTGARRRDRDRWRATDRPDATERPRASRLSRSGALGDRAGTRHHRLREPRRHTSRQLRDRQRARPGGEADRGRGERRGAPLVERPRRAHARARPALRRQARHARVVSSRRRSTLDHSAASAP